MTIREIDYGEGLAALLPAAQRERHTFLLESGLKAGGLGRYSVLGCDPSLVFTAWATRVQVSEGGSVREENGDPWVVLARLHRERSRPREDHPFPFLSGAVGYCSYESGLAWEKIVPQGQDDLNLPDLWFGFYEAVLVADEMARRLWVVADPLIAEASAGLAAALERRVSEWRSYNLDTEATAPIPTGAPPQANFTWSAYREAIARVRSYIASGDVYQVNLAQRFSATLPPGGALQVYARLRERSAAPFAAYLDCGYCVLAGSSPERFLRIDGRSVATRPIKGTRPRGQTAADDARLREELLASEKDRAELLMIVDLERNDLGRVCEPGSIRVSDLFHLEEYPTVFHLVAGVEGQLREGYDIFDVLRASFPGGSITGAPKVRAMQIINELEPHRRGVYTGAMGYLGFRGTAELNIAIRTVQCVEGQAYFHAGSGVVWDSEAAEEYAETLAKAKAMAWAVTGRELNRETNHA